MINVNNITKTYGDITAVDNVSFDIEQGEIVGLLGPNGAGKTTALRVITGYIHPDRGTVNIAGHDIIEESVEARRHLGYLPEFSPLYNDMDVVKYLQFIAGTRDIASDTATEQIKNISERCGILDQLHRPIAHLSKGYKQRVGLAQALLHDPEFLILDEPTTGLDPNQILDFRKLIREVGEEHTVFLSTHILQEVTALCDRIIIINEGSIVADGSQEDLRKAHGDDTVRFSVSLNDHLDVETVRSVLEEQEFVSSVMEGTEKQNGRGDGRVARFRISLDDERTEEAGGRLFGLARENDWEATEIAPEQPSLEEIFARLTQQERS